MPFLMGQGILGTKIHDLGTWDPEIPCLMAPSPLPGSILPKDSLSWPFGHPGALGVAKRWLFAGGVDRIYAHRLECPCLTEKDKSWGV